MSSLKFDPELCFSCDSYACLTECRYLSYDFERAREERIKIARGEYSRILEECKTCYACEEYCPYGNHPFYRIVELPEEYNVKIFPDSFMNVLIKRYKPEGEFRPKKVGKKVVHICLFPEFKDAIKGRLFEGYDVVRGRHIFCNLIYLHFGNISVIRERAGATIENMKKLGVEEVVLFHDECYGFYNSFTEAYGIEVPFKTVHIFEFLYSKLREMEDDVTKLNLKAAYQRPCSNRLSPHIDKVLDRLLELIGIERAEREFDRENSLCCGAAFEFQGRKDFAKAIQKENVQDMLSSGAEYVIFNCPMCYITLKKSVENVGLKPLMVSELCKMAIGEKPFILK